MIDCIVTREFQFNTLSHARKERARNSLDLSRIFSQYHDVTNFDIIKFIRNRSKLRSGRLIYDSKIFFVSDNNLMMSRKKYKERNTNKFIQYRYCFYDDFSFIKENEKKRRDIKLNKMIIKRMG
jgi:hypothetical protein